MVRTQVQLTEQQVRALRSMSRRRGVSMAALVREFVEIGLEQEAPGLTEQYNRASALVGAFEDSEGATDVAREHDRYLEDAYE